MDHHYLKNKVAKAPQSPGIYIFKGPTNKYLYIGKALNLKNRLKSYLKTEDSRLIKMISESVNLEFIITDSDIEALILESQYIKKCRPDFNIMLRDDKQYFYVGFSVETFPKIFLTHQPFNSTDFVGPFTDGLAIKTTLRLLRKIFPYCTCKQTHHNYCLNHHIGKCLGFCCLKQQNPNSKLRNQNAKLYRKNVKALKDILSGKKSSLIKDLEKEMKTFSKKQEYEKAQDLQYKIEKIKRVFENARIINQGRDFMIYHKGLQAIDSLQKLLNIRASIRRIEAYDVANIQGRHAVGAMVVFTDGKPDKNEYRKFKIYTKEPPDDTAMLKEVLIRRFRHPEWPMPDLILIDGGKGQLNTAKEVVSSMRQIIRVIALTKNEKHTGYKIITENGKEISLSKLPLNTKNFLLQIDSEAHRFAISYYRQLHRKSVR